MALQSLAPMLGSESDTAILIVYQVDMKKPETFFSVRDSVRVTNDVMSISNSRLPCRPLFLGIIASTILPIGAVRNVTNGR